MAEPYAATSADAGTPALSGENPSGTGVLGTSSSGVAVWGGSASSSGVGGMSGSAYGVHGVSRDSHGVHGDSDHATGVWGRTSAGPDQGHAGVVGEGLATVGVFGSSTGSTGVGGTSATAIGVHGVSESGTGVRGDSPAGTGVLASSRDGEAVHAVTTSPTVAAVAAFNDNPEGTGAAVYARKLGSQGSAGYFEGDVVVTGDIRLANADCAEDFDVVDTAAAAPGTVMVVTGQATLAECRQAYDRRVAGVVSGAGDYRPAIVLDGHGVAGSRRPLALVGKVFCQVDADYGPIDVGDLLTTSDTPGHAMRADDRARAFGAVLGKALRPLQGGRGLIPVLVALQ